MIDWRSANASNNWLRLLLFKCTVLTPHYQLIVQTQMIHYSRKTFRYLRCVKKFIYPEKGKIRQKFSGKKLQHTRSFFSVKAKCFSVFATPDPAAPCGCSTFRWKTVLDISFCSQMMETVALYNVIVDWNCFHGFIPLFNEKYLRMRSLIDTWGFGFGIRVPIYRCRRCVDPSIEVFGQLRLGAFSAIPPRELSTSL